MIIFMVKFKSALSDDEAMRSMRERKPQFQALPGLVQKYYGYEKATGEFTGIYLWDSQESFEEYRQSELAKSIPVAYKAQNTPRLEVFELIEQLRE